MDHRESPVAIVTGAASGIGLETARLLARQGWRVALAGRRREPLERAAGSLRPAETLVVEADMSTPETVRRLVEATLQRFARIDALVNNAGVARVLPVERTDLAALREAFETNTIGAGYAIHLCWPVFVRQHRGCVVNVSSWASLDPFPGFFAYAASKAALNLMATSCAQEGAAFGVRAFSVAPGAVETPLLRSSFDTAMVPETACLTPAEVARVIVECLEGRRDAANGRTIFLRRQGAGIEELVR